MTHISLDEFKSGTVVDDKFLSFNRFFDINKPTSTSNGENKSTDMFNSAIILTDNIIKIKKEDFETYTFPVLATTEDQQFYNLVLYVNNDHQIYRSHILLYTPSEKWLSDRTQSFSGKVEIANNDLLDVNKLFRSNNGHTQMRSSNDCVEDVLITYECGNGVEGHRSGSPGRPICMATNFYEYIDIIYGSCQGNGGGDNGHFDPGEGGSTSEGGGSNEGGIVTAPNLIPYDSQMKNFESGVLDATERSYYKSDSNIKNTVDWHLIGKNFSHISQQEAKLSIAFGNQFNLNFPQFNWVLNNQNSQSMADINQYLTTVIVDASVKGFIKQAIEAWAEDGEVDFEEEIINSLEGKALCIYNKLLSSSTGFKNAIKKFDGEFPVSHLSFKINNTLPSGNYGITKPPNNFNTTVEFSNTQLSNISDLGGAVAFAHEMIHAEIFRKMLSAAQKGNLDPANMTQQEANMTQQEQVAYVNSLRNNFPGIYDYYIERYKPTWNHNQMASHYRETIADIIEEFDDSSKSRQIYEDLSWVGLRILENGLASIAWDVLTQSEKDRVLSNFNTHFFNGTSNCN